MLSKLDLFDVEEQEIINRSVEDENHKNFQLSDMVRKIDFVLAINNDNHIRELYEGLKDKVLNLSDKEWGDICFTLPYELLYSTDDEYNEEL